jgi:hypothetical protein
VASGEGVLTVLAFRVGGMLAFLIFAVFVKVLVQQYLHQPSSVKVEEVLMLAENKVQVPQKLDGVTTLVAVKHRASRCLPISIR